jgi:hypothetical protein
VDEGGKERVQQAEAREHDADCVDGDRAHENLPMMCRVRLAIATVSAKRTMSFPEQHDIRSLARGDQTPRR